MATPTASDVPANVDLKECRSCRRWVTAALHAVVPIGAEATCGLCLAVGELQDAIRRSSLTEDREEAVHQALWRAHVLIVNCGGGVASRPYIPLVAGEQTNSE